MWMINKNYFELLIMYEYKGGVLKELFVLSDLAKVWT